MLNISQLRHALNVNCLIHSTSQKCPLQAHANLMLTFRTFLLHMNRLIILQYRIYSFTVIIITWNKSIACNYIHIPTCNCTFIYYRDTKHSQLIPLLHLIFSYTDVHSVAVTSIFSTTMDTIPNH